MSLLSLPSFVPTVVTVPTVLRPCCPCCPNKINELQANPLVSRIIQIRKTQINNSKHSPSRTFSGWKEDTILKILVDPISFELLKDPVMAPDGVTYSKESIVQYLNNHAGTIPGSDMVCKIENLVPNLIIKNVIEIRTKYLTQKSEPVQDENAMDLEVVNINAMELEK